MGLDGWSDGWLSQARCFLQTSALGTTDLPPTGKQSPAFPSPCLLWVYLGFVGASCKSGTQSSGAGSLPLEALGGLAWTETARGMEGCQLTRMIFLVFL